MYFIYVGSAKPAHRKGVLDGVANLLFPVGPSRVMVILDLDGDLLCCIAPEHKQQLCQELWCWRRLLRVPWTARRSNQSILKEISPGCSLEGLMLKLKLQYFGHLMRRVDSLEKTDAGRDWGQEEKGTTEDEMARWYHRLNGREFV